MKNLHFLRCWQILRIAWNQFQRILLALCESVCIAVSTAVMLSVSKGDNRDLRDHWFFKLWFPEARHFQCWISQDPASEHLWVMVPTPNTRLARGAHRPKPPSPVFCKQRSPVDPPEPTWSISEKSTLTFAVWATGWEWSHSLEVVAPTFLRWQGIEWTQKILSGPSDGRKCAPKFDFWPYFGVIRRRH